MYEFADTQFYSMVYHTIYHYDMAGTKFDTLYVSVLNPVVYQLADIKFCCMYEYRVACTKSCFVHVCMDIRLPAPNLVVHACCRL